MISTDTSSVAVAVSARTGTSPKRDFSPERFRYEGRKSWPHWLMQWASSTAMRLIRQVDKKKRGGPPHPPRERQKQNHPPPPLKAPSAPDAPQGLGLN